MQLILEEDQDVTVVNRKIINTEQEISKTCETQRKKPTQNSRILIKKNAENLDLKKPILNEELNMQFYVNW